MTVEDRVKFVMGREIAACMAGTRSFPTVGELVGMAVAEHEREQGGRWDYIGEQTELSQYGKVGNAGPLVERVRPVLRWNQATADI